VIGSDRKGSAAKRWMFLALGSVLVIGTGLGVLGDRLVLAADPVELATPVSGEIWFDCANEPEPPSEGERAERRAKHLRTVDAELGLDDEQEAAVAAVLADHGKVSREFWEATRTEYCDHLSSIRQQVRVMLTPEQQSLFDARLARIDEEWRQEHQRSVEARRK
jgi:hypothetical protein